MKPLVYFDTGTSEFRIATKLDIFQLDTAYTPTGAEPVGSMWWNPDDEVMSIKLTDNVTGDLTQETHLPCINQTGGDIADGVPVMYAGTVGNSGKIKIQLAKADGSILPQLTVGITTEPIANGDAGKVTWFGKVRGINTTGTLYGEVWNDGDILYVSPTTPGELTNVQPNAPDRKIFVAVVVKAHSNGTIFVHPRFTPRLAGLDDVSMTPSDGDLPMWNDANSRFEAVNVADIAPSGYTPGSVLFAGEDGTITQDNASLFWDDANNRMGIGTPEPTVPLQVYVASGNSALKLNNGNGSTVDIRANDTTAEILLLRGSSTSTNQIVFRGTSSTSYFLIGKPGSTENFRIAIGGWNLYSSTSAMEILTTGYVGINTIIPAKRIEILDPSGIQARFTHTAGSIFADVGVDANGYYSIIPSGLRVLLGTADNTKLMFGAGQDASIYYDGTNLNINPKEVGSGLCDILGDLRVASYVRHVQLDATPSGTVASQAAGVTIGVAVGLQFSSVQDKYAGVQWEVPGDWDGNDIIFEVDWLPDSASMSGTDTVQWILEYRAIAEGELITQGTVETVTVTNSDDNARYTTIHSPFVLDVDGANQPITVYDHMYFLLHRNTGVTNDFAGTVTVTAFEIVYTSRKIPRSN